MTVLEAAQAEAQKELSDLPLTDGMPPPAVEQLSRIARLKTYPAGRVLFSESNRHDRIHILCNGLVTLEMRVPDHGMRKILTVGRGELLAWSSLLSDGIMTTTAIATEPTRAVEFLTDDLKIMCEHNHEIGYHVMRQVAIALAHRLLATRLQLLDLFRS